MIDPEVDFLSWFHSLPVGQRQGLAYSYTLMTSNNSGDFALSGQEALEQFEESIGAPEFARRRVARLLSIRAIFTFIFSDGNFIRTLTDTFPNHPDFTGEKLVPLSPFQWRRGVVRWRRLIETSLSDSSLHRWLFELQRG